MSDSMEREKNESWSSMSMLDMEREEMKQKLVDMQLCEPDESYEQVERLYQFITESKDMANDNNNARKQSLRSSNECASEGVSKSNPSQESDDRSNIQKSLYPHDSNSPDSGDLSDKGANESPIPSEDCTTDDKDVPLKQPERRPVREREPFRSCSQPQTAETMDKVLIALNHHLRRMAELWYSWNRTADAKFQWGSPIQVGPANVSTDKKPLTSIKERACKRKLGSAGCSSSYDDRDELTSDEDNNDNNDNESETRSEQSVTSKKQRVDGRSDEGNTIDERAEGNFGNTLSITDEDDNDRVVLDSDDTTGLEDRLDRERKLEEEEEIVTEEPRYPRRIIPPNPRKGYNGPRKRRVVNAGASSSRVLDNLDSVGESSRKDSEERRPREEEKRSREDEKRPKEEKRPREEEKRPKEEEKINTEIKPLVIKNLSARLERQCMLLKRSQADKQKKLDQEREEAERREEEDRRRKEEQARKHMEEVQLRRRQREEAQKWSKEKSMKWNNVLSVKSKESKERSRTLREQEEARLAELEEENRLLQDSDMEVEEDNTNSINCPICDKPFPSDTIETHAASCEQYNTEEEVASGGMSSFRPNKSVTKKRNTARKSEILECNICSVFRTTNGIEYEDHVNSCMQRQSASQDASSSASVSIQDIPTSPIRCFRPISEQNDTEIDYRSQFASNSRNQIRPNRKRKR